MGENPDLPAVASDHSVIARIKSEIDISDRARIVTFGDRAQRAVVDFADRILSQTTRTAIAGLDAHIAAGKAFADEFRTGKLAALEADSKAPSPGSDGLIAAQTYQDAVQALDRLEKRLFYLQQARQIGIQQLPRIRIVQSGDETLIENLQATTELTIPVWKQKMILLLKSSLDDDLGPQDPQANPADAVSRRSA